MTNDQLTQLIAGITAAAQGGAAPPGQAAGAAVVVGPMQACSLGKDKIQRYKKWIDWIGDAENKMRFLGMTTDVQKISFVRSCAGPELTEFWRKEARIMYEATGDGADRVEAHTYKEMLEETKKTLLKLVSRDRAIIDLFRMEQGNRSFMEFLSGGGPANKATSTLAITCSSASSSPLSGAWT